MPTLVEVNRDGSKVEAVLQATKTGFFFHIGQVDGAAVVSHVKEMEVPQSDVEGEPSSPVPNRCHRCRHRSPRTTRHGG